MSSAGGPWSVKGIDPKAREMAKDLARRSGMTLGEWINQMILEGDDEDEPQPVRPPERARASRPYASSYTPAKPRLATPSGFSSRAGGGYRTAALRREEEDPEVAQPDDLGRMTAALERLSERIESAEHRSTAAIHGIDQSVTATLGRLEDAEREQGMVAGRIDEALQDLHDLHGGVAQRIETLEADETPRRSAEALKALEQALGRIAGQLYEGETRTQAALADLKGDLGGLALKADRADRTAGQAVEKAEALAASAPDVLAAALPAAIADALPEAVSAAVAQALAIAVPEAVSAAVPDAVAAAEPQAVADATPEPPPPPDLAAASAAVVDGVVARIAARIEQAEGRTADAMRSMEGSFAALDARLHATETRLAEPDDAPEIDPQNTVEARFERMAAALSERVEASRMEMAERLNASADARMDQVDAVVRDMTRHVEAAEHRSADAIERMGHEVLRVAQLLGRRVTEAETRGAEQAERIGATVDARLSRHDGAQAEAIERLGVEIARISERLADRIGASERRSAQAIDEVGEQVVRVTDKINQRYDRAAADLSDRIRQSEERTARLLEDARERIDQRIGEVQSRASGTLSPLAQSITALASRIDQLEAGSPFGPAGAFDPPTFTPPAYHGPSAFSGPSAFDPPTFVTPAASPPSAPSPSAAADRRTGEDRPTFDPFADFEAEAFEGPAEPSAAALASAAVAATEAEPLALSPFVDDAAADLFGDAEPAGEADERIEPVFADFLSDIAPATPDAVLTGADPFAEPAAEPASAAADPFAVVDEAPAARPGLQPLGPPRDESAKSRSTREMLESARAAARAASAPETKTGRDRAAAAPMAAAAATSASAPPLMGLSLPRLGAARPSGGGKSAPPSPLRTALFVSAALATVSLGAWAYWWANHGPAGPEPRADGQVPGARSGAEGEPVAMELTRPGAVAEPDAEAPAAPPGPAATAAALAGPQAATRPTTVPPRPAVTAPATPAPRAPATATPSPRPAAPPPTPRAAATATPRAAAPSGATLYAAGVAQLTGGQRTEGLQQLRQAADGGHGPAQFYLAKVYEEGRFGVPANPVEARRWTERAARAGETRAMHNLALFHFEGTGGDRNLSQAVQWFRRAADAGLVDSQYNLGRMYEQGLGVPQNGAEAFKWYVIAGAGGDGEARASVQRMRGQLSPEARSAAERSASAFRAQRGLAAPTVASATPPAPAAAPSDPGVAAAQRGLSRLGYYSGPSDGATSPALRAAVVAFQRAQGMPVTGQVDDALIARMAASTR